MDVTAAVEPAAVAGSRRWPSTTAVARSMSLRFEVRECSRIISKALGLVDGVAFHQHALGAFDQRAPPERAFEVLVFGEAAQHDVDRALPVLDVGVADMGEDASLGRLFDELRVACVEQDDHRAGGLAHDLLDQVERVLRALSEPDERDVGSLSGGHGADVRDVDLARDHLVSEGDHDRGDEREAILALVGDQDPQMFGLAVTHQRPERDTKCKSWRGIDRLAAMQAAAESGKPARKRLCLPERSGDGGVGATRTPGLEGLGAGGRAGAAVRLLRDGAAGVPDLRRQAADSARASSIRRGRCSTRPPTCRPASRCSCTTG